MAERKKATMVDFRVEEDPHFEAEGLPGKDKRFHSAARFAEYPGLKLTNSTIVSNELYEDIGREGVEGMLRSLVQAAADERLNGDAA